MVLKEAIKWMFDFGYSNDECHFYFGEIVASVLPATINIKGPNFVFSVDSNYEIVDVTKGNIDDFILLVSKYDFAER